MQDKEPKDLTDEEKMRILEDFAKKMLNQKPLEPEFAKILNDNFWDLLA